MGCVEYTYLRPKYSVLAAHLKLISTDQSQVMTKSLIKKPMTFVFVVHIGFVVHLICPLLNEPHVADIYD